MIINENQMNELIRKYKDQFVLRMGTGKCLCGKTETLIMENRKTGGSLTLEICNKCTMLIQSEENFLGKLEN